MRRNAAIKAMGNLANLALLANLDLAPGYRSVIVMLSFKSLALFVLVGCAISSRAETHTIEFVNKYACP